MLYVLVISMDVDYNFSDYDEFFLTDSVGLGGANKGEDVYRLKSHMIDLGYDWLDLNSQIDNKTIKAIKLFQAAKNGDYVVNRPHNDGLVEVNKDTYLWLQADNAPGWLNLPVGGSLEEGYFNYEVADGGNSHGYGTTWLAETISLAGKEYYESYLIDHEESTLIIVNDASVPHGGDTPDHKTHETGLSADLRLPRKGGGYGGITWRSRSYDRNAMRAQLKALKGQDNMKAILFNDPVLRREGLCTYSGGHDNHVHFHIKPLERYEF